MVSQAAARHAAAFNAATTGIKEVIVIGPDKIIYRLP